MPKRIAFFGDWWQSKPEKVYEIVTEEATFAAIQPAYQQPTSRPNLVF